MARLGAAIVCWFIACTCVGVLRADELSFPGAGTRVRLRSGGLESGQLVGTLAAVDQQSLTVTPEAGGKARVFARQDIVRLERSVSPSRRRQGGWIGFGVGLAAVVGKVALQGGCNDGCDSSNVLTGALVGLSTATVGALVSPDERWSDVALERSQARAGAGSGLQIRLAPQFGRRAGLSIVASF